MWNNVGQYVSKQVLTKQNFNGLNILKMNDMEILSDCQRGFSQSREVFFERSKTYGGIKSLLTGRIRHILFLLLGMCIFLAGEARGQEIREIGEYVKSSGFQSSDPFMDLRYGSGGIMEISGGGTVMPRNGAPRNLLIDSSDLGSLPTAGGQYGTVQFMQLNIGEGGSFSLNYMQLAAFPGLQYLLLVSASPLTAAGISQMLTGFEESGIVILYQISRPG